MSTRLLRGLAITHIVYAAFAILYLIGGGAVFYLLKGIKYSSVNPLVYVWLIISLAWAAGEMYLGIDSVKHHEDTPRYPFLARLCWIVLGSAGLELVFSIIIGGANATHIFLTAVISGGLSFLMIYCMRRLAGNV